MELENFYTDSQIATAAGNVTVLNALKNINFSQDLYDAWNQMNLVPMI